MNKLLSIIVPSYNMEKYLPKCLGSLVVDDPSLLEKLDVIVVNDGSKDRTSEIAHGFEKKYPGVFRVIDKANGHYGSCINAALPVAQGKYVRILDADDFFDTKVFCQYLAQVNKLVQLTDNDMPDLVLNDFVWEQGETLRVHSVDLPVNTIVNIESPKVKLSFLCMHQIAHRTANLVRMGYFQTEGICYTDNEWCHLPISLVNRIVYFKLPLYRYQVGREGQSIDPKELHKNFPMWCREASILSSNVLNAQNVSEKVKTYLIDFAMVVIRRVYLMAIIDRLSIDNPLEFKKLDEVLSLCPELYERTLALSCGPNHFPFKFVEYFRKHGYGVRWSLRNFLNTCLIRLAISVRYSRWRCKSM